MTGLERNADVVHMASYAPLFAHVDGWQWTPDLIWFDNLRSFGTPNYYVQKLFATNRGTRVVPLTANSHPVEGELGLYASAARDDSSHELILKIVNTNTNVSKVTIDLQGSLRYTSTARQWLMTASPEATNSLDSPSSVAPIESTVELKGKKLNLELKPESFTVVRVALK